jgi:hypothetical protein
MFVTIEESLNIAEEGVKLIEIDSFVSLPKED